MSFNQATQAKGKCPIPEALRPIGAFNCHEWAYLTHPKSFRSSHGYNTNVWAAHKNETAGRLLKFKGVASLFHPDQDMKVRQR